MSRKREGTLLEDVAKKIGSTLGVVVAEASKVVRPLRTTGSSVRGMKTRAHARRSPRKWSPTSSRHSANRKRKRAMRRRK